MPGGRIVKSADLYEADPLARPYALKPVNEGSSVGVAIVTDDGNYGNPIGRDVRGPWQEFDELLAEPFIRGRELTTAVLGDQALGVTERSEEHTYELQPLMRTSYAVFCWTKKITKITTYQCLFSPTF